MVSMQRSAVQAAGDPDDERALVERAGRGDVQAWTRLYQRHHRRVLKHVAYLVCDAAAAEDLAQETFARAHVALPQYEARGSFVGWLRGIAVNVVRTHWRARRRGDAALEKLGRSATEVAEGCESDPEGAHLRRSRAAALSLALARLPEPLREAFVLCDLEDLPVREAAEALGVSPGNLRVRATRARAKIREELTRLGWFAPGPAGGDGP